VYSTSSTRLEPGNTDTNYVRRDLFTPLGTAIISGTFPRELRARVQGRKLLRTQEHVPQEK